MSKTWLDGSDQQGFVLPPRGKELSNRGDFKRVSDGCSCSMAFEISSKIRVQASRSLICASHDGLLSLWTGVRYPTGSTVGIDGRSSDDGTYRVFVGKGIR